MERTAVLAACLEVIATADTALDPGVLDELLLALRPLVSCFHIGLARAESPGFFRMLAMSRGAGESALPLRQRLASIPGVYETVYERGECFFAFDLNAGTELERAGASLGFGGYIAVPVRRGNTTVASLLLGFRDAEQAKGVDLPLLQQLAAAMVGSVERGLSERHRERAARILEASGDAMLAWDSEGRIVDANRAAEELVGAPRSELIGSTVQQIFRSMPLGTSQNQRLELSRKDGQRLVVAATISPVRGDPLVFANALLRDLSEVVAAEAEASMRLLELERLSEQHTLLLDNAPLLIFRLDPRDAQLLYLNRHAERLFGVSAEHALRTPDFLRQSHIDPDGALSFEEAVIVAQLGGVMPAYEARLSSKGAEPITARGVVYPVLDGQRTVVGLEGVLLDVTSERAARSRLVQADRLATVGMLSAGVAHEINNPAAFMLLGLDVLSRTLSGPHVSLQPTAKQQLSQLVTDLRETARRIVNIARDMRMFASPPSNIPGRTPLVDVARVVDSALTITRAQIVEKAELVVALDTDLPLVPMDEGRLGQVLVNLLVNAAQAVAEGQELSGARSHRDLVRIDASVVDGAVRVRIIDSGVGMTEDVLERAFQPFFSTKSTASEPGHPPSRTGLSSSGTGLGLAICRTLVEGAGGTVRAQSPSSFFDPPRGTELVVTLPVLHPVASAERGDESLRAEQRARVLIIEDELLLGKALADQLSELHEVVLASAAEEALAAMAQRRFDVVLCDLRMPVMSGDDLHATVLSRDPEQAGRFVFMTGVGLGDEILALRERTGLPLIEKPFPMKRLLGLIDTVLVERGPVPARHAPGATR